MLSVKMLIGVVLNVDMLSEFFDMFNVVILNVIRQSVVTLNIDKLSVSFLSANRLNVAAPRIHFCLDGH